MQGIESLDNFKSFVSSLGGLGRFEDTYIVHAAEGETVVPMEVLDQNPLLKKRLFKTMMDMGIEPGRYIVGNELNSKNPITGQPEFFLKKIVSQIRKAIPGDLENYLGPLVGLATGNPFLGGLAGAIGSGTQGAIAGGLGGLQSPGIKGLGGKFGTELPGIFGEYGQRLIMIDVNDNAESTKNKSYCNIGEAKIAAEHLKLLLDLKQNAIAITPYKGQVDQIRSILPVNYRNKVKTVDGYQGKEADFIILSLVRNNKRTGSSRRWGFFRDPRRINVALSRAREGLLVISSVEQIKNTDWSEGEGQLSKFVDSVIESGQIVTGGSENE